MSLELGVQCGIRWKCRTCGHYQEPIPDEEWPYCCGVGMSIQPWYKLGPVFIPKEGDELP